MSTQRLRPGSSIAELLHSLTKGAATSRRAAAGTASGGASHEAVDARNPAVLRRDLAALTAGVDLDSAPAVRALLRPVVRRILTWEFGAAFIEHPDYQQVLAGIESAMDADPAAPRQFLAMLRDLQKKKPA